MTDPSVLKELMQIHADEAAKSRQFREKLSQSSTEQGSISGWEAMRTTQTQSSQQTPSLQQTPSSQQTTDSEHQSPYYQAQQSILSVYEPKPNFPNGRKFQWTKLEPSDPRNNKYYDNAAILSIKPYPLFKRDPDGNIITYRGLHIVTHIPALYINNEGKVRWYQIPYTTIDTKKNKGNSEFSYLEYPNHIKFFEDYGGKIHSTLKKSRRNKKLYRKKKRTKRTKRRKHI
jgi:hypothetical protein